MVGCPLEIRGAGVENSTRVVVGAGIHRLPLPALFVVLVWVLEIRRFEGWRLLRIRRLEQGLALVRVDFAVVQN